MDLLESILWNSWLVVGEMAPYLLFGFLVAGVLSVCVSPAWVERNLGGAGWGSIVKASLFGVPLPLCSCGVIPVSASIYRHGASRGATTAFLLSTPQTGVDSIAITYALLGPVFAVFRPIAALVTGLFGGGLVMLLADRRPDGDDHEHTASGCQAECCSPTASHNSLPLRAIRYGFVTLPRDIGGSLLLGVLIAGLIGAVVGEGQLTAYLGGGVFSILLLMALGVPLYVCATASVPIAAGFIHAGVSPGAALAFLIAGPATNAATFTTVWGLLGRRTAVVYIATVAVSAVVCGLLLNGLFAVLQVPVGPLIHDHAAASGGWLAHAWAIALLALMILTSKPVARLVGRSTAMTNESDQPTPGQQRIVLRVGGMTCSHCAESVRRALAACDRVAAAEVDLARGRAQVTGERLDPGQLISAVTELGYSADLSEEEGT